MDLRRLRPFDALTGLLGAALVGLLWVHWFGHENAWQSMAVNDVILFIAGLLGVWVLVSTATYSTAAVPIAAAAFATFVGLLASVLALIRLAWPPDLGPGPTHREAGVWLGAAAAIGLFMSAAASMRSERLGKVGSTNVPVTQLPAPTIREEGA